MKNFEVKNYRLIDFNTIIQNIPEKPMIPLHNFLLDLIDDSDGKEKSIYLNNTSNLLKEIWSEIIFMNWRILNVRDFIPNNFGITTSTFYGYKNGRKNISIPIMYNLICQWRVLCNKELDDVDKKWDEVFNKNFLLSTRSKCQKTSLPRFINPKLSYILGWICGDGNLQFGKNHYVIKISEKSINQLKFVLTPLFFEIFGVIPSIYKRYGNGYAIQIGSKPILRFLKNVMKIKIGEIPDIVYEFDRLNKLNFLKGIFDAEGYVNSKYKHSTIIISQSSEIFLKKIINLFKEIGIIFIGPQFHKTELGVWYTIRIRKKLEILKFIEIVGSNHVDKIQKLNSLRNEIEKNWNC